MSDSLDLVSVIMPAYNAEDTIAIAIESVLSQTHTSLELVIVDDCSADGTADIVRAYKDERVRLISHGENLGEGAARDEAICNSRGDWLAVIDADDAWTERRLETMLSHAEKASGECMVVDNILRCFEADGVLVPWKPLNSLDNTFYSSGEKNMVDFLGLPGYLIKPLIPRKAVARESLRHSDRKYGADAEFFIRLLKRSPMPIHAVSEPMYLYRLSEGAMSAVSGRRDMMSDMLANLESELDFSPAELRAIHRKIRILKRGAIYEDIQQAFERGHFRRAIAGLARHPECLALFFWRLPGSLSYKWHLRQSGGVGRSLY